jgi:putative protein-disulfide isomerase
MYVRPKKKMNSESPLHCNPDSGLCEVPADRQTITSNARSFLKKEEKPVRILYFTDPICSSCWGIEPQLRRLKAEYGESIEIEYRMGGLLPDWSYNSGGISKPSDVAAHWEEASKYYQMPIDGNVWLEDPLSSSYPPSIAFKAAQLQNQERALTFLRRLREMVFMEKKNIARLEFIRQAAMEAGLNPEKMLQDMEGTALQAFYTDLEVTRSMAIRGFPTLIFSTNTGERQVISGYRPYANFEQAMKTLVPESSAQTFDSSPKGLFARYSSLTSLEFATLAGTSLEQAEQLLSGLGGNGKLKKFSIANGNLWKRIP